MTRESVLLLSVSSSPVVTVSVLPRGGEKLKASKSAKLRYLVLTSADTRTGRLAAGPPDT
jgi:hypothetical protein